MAFSSTVAQRGINSPYDSLIIAASASYNVPLALIKGIISQESAWDPNATHVDNPADPYAVSYGLMQLVWKYFQTSTGGPITDPAENIDKGTSVIAQQLSKRNGNVELAIAGYNAGTSRTDQDLLTRLQNNTLGVADHVRSVIQYQNWFIANDPASGGGTPLPLPAPGEIDSDVMIIAGIVVFVGLMWVLIRR